VHKVKTLLIRTLVVLLSIVSVLADGPAPDKAKEWTYGPYDGIRSERPSPTPEIYPPIIQIPPSERRQILIYRGTRPEAVELSEEAIVRPTGKNIVMPSAHFDAAAKKIRAGMDSSQIIEVLGQPKEIKTEKGWTEWSYATNSQTRAVKRGGEFW
jgi:hypothetical protein